jgi:hypothetical protein
VEKLLDGEAQVLTRKVVEKALVGDMAALRLCLERIVPPRRDRPVEFELPEINTTADALAASSALLSACAAGHLSPREAAEIMELISTHVRTLEVADIEARLPALGKACPS